MVLVIRNVEQAIRLGLVSQEVIDKYGIDKIQKFIENDADDWIESQIVADENEFTIDNDCEYYLQKI